MTATASRPSDRAAGPSQPDHRARRDARRRRRGRRRPSAARSPAPTRRRGGPPTSCSPRRSPGSSRGQARRARGGCWRCGAGVATIAASSPAWAIVAAVGVRDRRRDRRPAAQPAGRAGAVGGADDQRPAAVGPVVAVRHVGARDRSRRRRHRGDGPVAPRTARPANRAARRRRRSAIVAGVAVLGAVVAIAQAYGDLRNGERALRAGGVGAAAGRHPGRRRGARAQQRTARTMRRTRSTARGRVRHWRCPCSASTSTRSSTSATEPVDLTDQATTSVAQVDVDSLRVVDGVIDLDAIEVLERPFGETNAALRRMSDVLASARSPWLVAPVGDRVDELADEIDELVEQTDRAADRRPAGAVDARARRAADVLRRLHHTGRGARPRRVHGHVGRAARRRRPARGHPHRPDQSS